MADSAIFSRVLFWGILLSACAYGNSTLGVARPQRPGPDQTGNKELLRLRLFLKGNMHSSGSPWLGHGNGMAEWFRLVLKENYTILMDLLACDENRCQNNGTCLDLRGQSTCYCPPQWTGDLCDRKKIGLCERYWCPTRCLYGLVHNDTHDCLKCECKENPCNNKNCAAEEECSLESNRCDPGDTLCERYTATCAPRVTCRKGSACRVACRYGFKTDKNGCGLCDCANDPCATVKCQRDHRCVSETIHCGRRDTKCTPGQSRAVCKAVVKPGTCRADATAPPLPNDRGPVLNMPQKGLLQPSPPKGPSMHVMSPVSACVVGCEDDVSCPELFKCCSNGCGRECQKPVYLDDSPCPMRREEAIQNNMTMYVPDCTPDGLFKPKQCLRGRVNATVCACVNILTGSPFPDSLLVGEDHNCTAASRQRVVCPPVQCEQFCQFGTHKDPNGCDTCVCDDDPCKRHACRKGLVCELIKFRCWSDKCQYEAHCVDESWEDDSCPRGKVLRTEGDQLPVTCWNHVYTSKASTCPKTHYCRKMQDIRDGYTGVCCPASNGDAKPGVCPTKETAINGFQSLYMFRGTQHCYYDCRTDDGCPDIKKCCPSPYGCGMRCAMPMPSVNATCHSKLRESILIAKVHGDSPLFMPRCHFNGTWQSVQCFDQYGVCWCIDEGGDVIPGTHTRGIPNCKKPSASQDVSPNVCPAGVAVHMCSLTLCMKAICPAVPHAVCRINPCGGCKTEFHDKDNHVVNCTQGISICERSNLDHSGDIVTRPIYVYPRLLNSDAERIFHVNSGRDQLGNSSTRIDDGYYPGITPYLRYSPYAYRSPRAYCPASRSINGPCFESCSKNKDCVSGLMCCTNRCGGKECTPPNSNYARCLKEKEKSTCNELAYYLEVKGSYYFDSQNLTCAQYEKPICEVNHDKSNRFYSMADCQRNCLEVYPLRGVFRPHCIASPDPGVVHRLFSTTQCLDAFCWCVLPTGAPVEGTLTKGEVECDTKGKIVWSSGPQSVCPDGKVPKICAEACHRRSCESDVYASCLADPCNDCNVTFVDSVGKPVKCQEQLDICSLPLDRGHCGVDSTKTSLRWFYDGTSGMCKTFKHSGCGGNENSFYSKSTCVATCKALVCDRKHTLRLCLDVCSNATCPRFPEALCIGDPCTCEPNFVDMETQGVVECTHLKTICQRMRAENLRTRLLTFVRPEAVHVMECEADGSFRAMQCSDHHKTCWCVDAEGYTLSDTTKDMSDHVKPVCVMEKTMEAVMEFRINKDYREIISSFDEFKSAWIKKLADVMQIPEANIINFNARSGSIIVSFTVVSDGKTDVDSSVEYVTEAIVKGELSVEFNEQQYMAVPVNITVSHIRVPVDSGSDVSNLTSRDLADLVAAPPAPQSFLGVVDDNRAAVVGGILGFIAVIVMAATVMCVLKARNRNSTPEDHIRFANTPEDAQSVRSVDAHSRGLDDHVVFGQPGLHSTA